MTTERGNELITDHLTACGWIDDLRDQALDGEVDACSGVIGAEIKRRRKEHGT